MSDMTLERETGGQGGEERGQDSGALASTLPTTVEKAGCESVEEHEVGVMPSYHHIPPQSEVSWQHSAE